MPGFAARARLRFSFLNSARHFATEIARSSVQLSSALSDDAFWGAEQRVEINTLIHEISIDGAFTALAHSRWRFCLRTSDSQLLFAISAEAGLLHIIHLLGILENMLGWDTYHLFGEN